MIVQHNILDSLAVARTAGLNVQCKGSRWWTCCPLHNERTPSFCIFPDGRFKCFGCGANGDAADLYAALYHVPLGEALRVVHGENWRPQPRKPDGHDLRRAVEAWKGERWREACAEKHAAWAIIKESTDNEKFWQAVADEATANDKLNLLDAATPRQLVGWMEAERDTI